MAAKSIPDTLKTPAVASNCVVPSRIGAKANDFGVLTLCVISILTVSLAEFVFPTIFPYLSARAIIIDGNLEPLLIELIDLFVEADVI